MLRVTTTHTKITARLESSPWWLNPSDLPGNSPNQCTLPSLSISVTDLLTIGPLLICLDLGWIPLGKCAPSLAGNCTLVIPLSESPDKGLKLSTLGYWEMGQKDLPGYDLMITREPQMCPPQLSHPQWMENVPQMISLSESDEKPRNRCTFPSSQLGWKGIYGLSLDDLRSFHRCDL
jgi:hypothetical protein